MQMSNPGAPDGQPQRTSVPDADAATQVVYQPVARQDGLPNRVKRQLLGMITEGTLRPGMQTPARTNARD